MTDQTATQGDDSLTEVTLELRDRSYPLVALSADCETEVELLETVAPGNGSDRLLEFFRVADTRLPVIESAAESCERVDEWRVLDTYDSEFVVETHVNDCIAHSLANVPTILTAAVADGGRARLRIHLAPGADANAALEGLTGEHPAVSVTSIRSRSVAGPLLTSQSFRAMLVDRLTDRQWEALALACESGYFERPRQTTQNELAASMGISQETFSQHLQAGQRRLFSLIFEEDRFASLEV